MPKVPKLFATRTVDSGYAASSLSAETFPPLAQSLPTANGKSKPPKFGDDQDHSRSSSAPMIDHIPVRQPSLEEEYTVPSDLEYIERNWAALDAMIEDFVQSLFRLNWPRVRRSAVAALDLTEVPHRILEGDKTWRLLFVAQIWQLLQDNMFHRASTFWAGEEGARLMTQYKDTEVLQMTPPAMEKYHLHRSREAKRLLAAHSTRKPDKTHDLAMTIFFSLAKLYDFDYLRADTGEDMAQLICCLRIVVRQAEKVDVALRRSRSEYRVIGPLPLRSHPGDFQYREENMTVENRRNENDDTVVLMVSPVLLWRGSVDGDNESDQRRGREWSVAIKSRVVVGKGEEDDDLERTLQKGEADMDLDLEEPPRGGWTTDRSCVPVLEEDENEPSGFREVGVYVWSSNKAGNLEWDFEDTQEWQECDEWQREVVWRWMMDVPAEADQGDMDDQPRDPDTYPMFVGDCDLPVGCDRLTSVPQHHPFVVLSW